MKFADIEQFPHSNYAVNVELKYLKPHLERWEEKMPNTDYALVMNPEWQRGRVWTDQQKISFMEYFLKGGKTGRDVYFNCSSWAGKYDTPLYCVDGLQRITAAVDFLDNKIKVFGHYYSEYEDSVRLTNCTFVFHVLQIKTKRDLLKVYIDFNSGGTPHNPKEIERIKKMLAETPEGAMI